MTSLRTFLFKYVYRLVIHGLWSVNLTRAIIFHEDKEETTTEDNASNKIKSLRTLILHAYSYKA